MKAGESFDCPHCGKNSFLKLESLLDGWEKKADLLKCASCGAEIGRIPVSGEKKNFAPCGGTEKNSERLKALLGDVEMEKRLSLTAEKEEKQFCRDCRHFFRHPFLSRCLKTEKEVNPMDDCDAFEEKVDDIKRDQ